MHETLPLPQGERDLLVINASLLIGFLHGLVVTNCFLMQAEGATQPSWFDVDHKFTMLCNGVKYGDVSRIEVALSKGADINFRGSWVSLDSSSRSSGTDCLMSTH